MPEDPLERVRRLLPDWARYKPGQEPEHLREAMAYRAYREPWENAHVPEDMILPYDEWKKSPGGSHG